VPRHRLADAQWERVGPLLPPERGRPGRPSRDNRLMLDAMLWCLAAGLPWRDLPSEFGPWQSVYTRFSRWRDAGVLERVLRELQSQAHRAGELDWDLHHVDSSVVRAQRSAAGAKRGAATRPSGAAEAAGARSST
jgi:transposase